MKNQTLVKVTLVSIVFILGTTMALALEPIPQESGFSGFFRPGVGYMSYKTNMVASFLGFDLSDEKTDSLFGSKPMNFYVSAAFVEVDANIDFYEQQAIFSTIGVFFKW